MSAMDLGGAVDLSERRAVGPGSIDIKVITRYAGDVYADIREAFPAFGIGSSQVEDGDPIPGLAFTAEDGVVRIYLLEPTMLDFLRAHLGASGEALDVVERLLDKAEGDVRAAAEAVLIRNGRDPVRHEAADEAEVKVPQAEALDGDEAEALDGEG